MPKSNKSTENQTSQTQPLMASSLVNIVREYFGTDTLSIEQLIGFAHQLATIKEKLPAIQEKRALSIPISNNDKRDELFYLAAQQTGTDAFANKEIVAHINTLREAQVQIIGHPGDEPFIILARTVNELQGRARPLLDNNKAPLELRAQLHAIENPETQNSHSIEHLIQMNAAIDSINNALFEKARPKDLNATKMDLRNLGLTRFTPKMEATLAQYTNLQELLLDDNQLTTAPEIIGQLVQLRILALSRNQLASIPEIFGQLAQLRILDLSRNQLAALPDSIGKLIRLEVLHLGNNQLTTVPEFIGRFTQLRKLYLNDLQLTTLPKFISILTRLEHLYLGDNRLKSVPEFIRELSHLKVLHLGDNQLVSVPEFIGRLTQLESLYLNNNWLTAVPEFIGRLARLRNLNLSDNQLTVLPGSIRQLSRLRYLNLSDNQLTVLPGSIRQLSRLRRLGLSYNKITSMPEWMKSVLVQTENMDEYGHLLTQTVSVPELAASSSSSSSSSSAYTPNFVASSSSSSDMTSAQADLSVGNRASHKNKSRCSNICRRIWPR